MALKPMQRAKLDRVARAAQRRQEAEDAYREAIRDAVAQKVPMRTVAEVAGASASRVHQIVHSSQ